MKRPFAACALALALLFAPALALAQTISGGGCGSGITCTVQSATYTVGSGGNFATVTAAMAWLNGQILPPGGLIGLSLLDGVISEPGPILVSSSFGKQISIISQHTYSHTLSSVQSSSGSAGAWTYVLNLDSVSGIVVGDYETLRGLTGGTNPQYISGVWPVTVVDAVNNRITVTTTGHAAAAASGAVTGGAIDFKGTLKFAGTDGFRIWNGATGLNVDQINVVGDGAGSTIGISLQDGDRLNVGDLSVYGFSFANVLSLYNSELNGTSLVTSGGGGIGVLAENGGTIDLPTIVSTGNVGADIEATIAGTISSSTLLTASGGGASGLFANQGGVILASGTINTTGNTGAGYTSGTQGILALTGTINSANNGASDQAQFYAANGTISMGASAIGYTAPCSTYEQCINGALRVDASNIRLDNQSGAAAYYVDSDGQAQIQFRDKSGSAKWEFGHIGSSSYDLRLWNDGLGAQAFKIFASDSHIVFNGTVTPGSVAVTGTNSCSNAGARAWVTDATVAFSSSTRGGNITGGGSNAVPAYCDGSKWDFD